MGFRRGGSVWMRQNFELFPQRNATPEEILAAYRHWAILYHPDK